MTGAATGGLADTDGGDETVDGTGFGEVEVTCDDR